MNKIQTFLQTPYPVFYQRWKVILLSSAIVFLVLALLQPFGISSIEQNKLGILLGYMLVTVVFLCVPIYIFPCLFPKFYNEERWCIGKYLLNNLLIFLFITVGNWIYSSILFNSHYLWNMFVSFLIATVIVGLFPSVVLAMLNRSRLLSLHLKEAMEMNLHLQRQSVAFAVETIEVPEGSIKIQGSSREVLELNPSHLLYIEAEGNYIKINYHRDGKVVQKLMRATMKQTEEVTEGYSYIVKCHRAFLVNVKAVCKVSGNSQGYRLSFEQTNFEVPVSRAYSKEVKTLIESMNDK